MAGTPSLENPFQRGSLFDGGSHGITELNWCNNGWPEGFMMGTGMVLFPITPNISMFWLLKVAEFPLAILASEPVKIYGNWFGGLGDNFIIDEAVWYFVVSLDGH